jgi:hypothetical protein
MSHCHRYEKCHPNRAPLPRTNEREVSMRTMAPVLRLPAIVAVATWSACLLLLPLLLLAASNPLASSSSSSWFHHPQGIDDGVLSSSKRKESRRIQKPKRRVLNSSRNLQKFWQSSSSLVEVQNRPLEYEGYQSHRELAFGTNFVTAIPRVCVDLFSIGSHSSRLSLFFILII